MEIKHYDSIEAAVTDHYGDGARITDKRAVAGGDINDAYAVSLSTGESCFLKTNRGKQRSFFDAEAAGLTAIASTKTVRTPEVLGTGTDAGTPFLLLSFIRSAGRNDDYWEVFGRELATMHLAEVRGFSGDESAPYGFFEDNFIGATPQHNTPETSFITFFRDHRLQPQFRMADHYFSEGDRRKITGLLDHMDRYYIEPEQPALLHGDLWSGNVIAGDDGRAWIIDPAVYVGHPEADLAMTELFGRFPERFYAAYQEINPLRDGYQNRRDMYNLYHLLNHLNLFGSSYLSSVRSILKRV